MWQQQWILGNWKMNGRLAACHEFARALSQEPLPENVCAGIAAPIPYAAALGQAVGTRLLAGAQDVSRFAADGAYTGETSAAMLADIGMDFVLVGHSERRQYFGEDQAVLSAKIDHSAAAGLIPVLCVGESLAEREAGREQSIVAGQLAILQGKALRQIAVAYEPVWAIGTGAVATTEQIADMHAFIYRQILSLCGEDVKIRVLYGGSVKVDNAAAILALPQVDGALVGGASLQAASFAAIIHAAASVCPQGGN